MSVVNFAIIATAISIFSCTSILVQDKIENVPEEDVERCCKLSHVTDLTNCFRYWCAWESSWGLGSNGTIF